MVNYKVSYVVQGSPYTGAIVDRERAPQVGDEVHFENAVFEITEVEELMPATDDFGFVHATCRFVRKL